MKAAGLAEWWDAVGASVKLSELLGTKKARDTGNRVQERLKELCRWRNQLAHGGDEEIALSEAQLIDSIHFVESFSEALSNILHKRL